MSKHVVEVVTADEATSEFIEVLDARVFEKSLVVTTTKSTSIFAEGRWLEAHVYNMEEEG